VYPVGSSVTVNAGVSDPGSGDTHTCVYDWDDGSAPTGDACSQSHLFVAAGVYSVSVVATDDDGGVSSPGVILIVVYDPTAGFVTGGGTVNSPAGAYAAGPTLAGSASFGFVSKYKKGATKPDGETEFQFKLGNFNFHSTSYDWLVVSGTKAQYKGYGTVNGGGVYGFLLSATDGGKTGPDKFRIKIWDPYSGDAVVYDNVGGGSDDIDAANPATITSGSIVVHK
jgi:hypothetical protein